MATQLPATIPVIRVGGGPRTRGRVHGELLREQVRDHVARFDGWVSADGESPVAFRQKLVARTGLVRAVDTYCPRLLEETRGLAEGAGISFDEAMCLQLMDEAWWLAKRRDHNAPHHCSSIGVRRPGQTGTIVAQNMDLPHYMDGLQIVLCVEPDGDEPEVAVLSAAGMIALTGINSAGVAVCVNVLTQLESSVDGVPVAFLIRSVLACRRLDEAARLLRAWPHATGQNYLVGDPVGLVDLECSANATAEVRADASVPLLHTNHPLANEDRDDRDRRKTDAEREDAEADTRARFDFLASEVGDAGEVDVDRVKRLLASPEIPICVPNRGDGWLTFGSVVMECSPDAQRLHVTHPPATAAEYHSMTLGEGGPTAP